MSHRTHDWQEEWQEERDEQLREEQREEQLLKKQLHEEQLREELAERGASIPCSDYTRREAQGRRKVYIIQTCHWEYNDSFDEPSASGGKAVAAFTTREKALRHLRELEETTGQGLLGIVEVYLEHEEGAERGPQTT